MGNPSDQPAAPLPPPPPFAATIPAMFTVIASRRMAPPLPPPEHPSPRQESDPAPPALMYAFVFIVNVPIATS
jgi:hypothetical protein